MKIGWRGLLGVVISIALLWWTLRDVSFAEVWDVLRQSRVGWFIVAALVATLSFPIRAWRWRYILEPTAGALPFGALWRATAIGMMVNNVSPARAGELARAYVVAHETRRLRFAAALASLVVDRVFDTVVVLVLLMTVVLLPGFPSGAMVGTWPVEKVLLVGTGGALVALLMLVVIALNPALLLRIAEPLIGRVAPKLLEKGRAFLISFGSGLGVLRDPRRSAIVFFWALVMWLVNGASFWIAFRAVDINATLPAALFLQSILAFAVAVPSAPGFFGLFEAATKVALRVYGIDDTLAVSYALGYHLLSFIPITVIGFWYLGRLGLHLNELGDRGETTDRVLEAGD